MTLTATPIPAPPTAITHQVYPQAHNNFHLVTIPPDSGAQLDVAVSQDLAPLAELADRAGAIAAINAGFFDPSNGLTTSYVTVAGELVADPRQNTGLMDNPALEPFLEAILDRSEFRIYTCNPMSRVQPQYAIVRHSAPLPAGCALHSAVGAGPQLLPTQTGFEEGFLARGSEGTVVRDVLGTQSANARSAVGLRADGTVLLVMAGQRPEGLSNAPGTGVNFADLVTFLQQQGAESALNLDGGSSSGLFYRGKTVYGRLDNEGMPVERPIKSMLLVR